MQLKTQVMQEINNQILYLMNLNSNKVIFEQDAIYSEKLKIMSEMETLEEGWLVINKK
ncbi:MAG: hypothetical protein H7263_18095 [Candidatus Sericytochromatia bacterium]|nr:hypothetical protein [Candidatus Sericytochromatia bacterium]